MKASFLGGFFYFSGMEQHTDKKKLYKGMQILAFALPLMVLGPVGISLGFKTESKLILAIGIIFGIFAIYLAFRGILRMMDAVFSKKR